MDQNAHELRNGTRTSGSWHSGVNEAAFDVDQVMLTVFYFLGMTGNIGALAILRRNETARNKRQTLMLKCLAWNDLLAVTGSAIQMHLQIYLPSAWVLTPYFCGVRVFWRAFGLGSGCVALAMAVERWLALTKPFVYQTVSSSSSPSLSLEPFDPAT